MESSDDYLEESPGAGAYSNGAATMEIKLAHQTEAIRHETATRPDADARNPAPGDGLLSLARDSLEDDKAEDIVTIDLRGRTELADHMVVASGRSPRHVAAVSEHLVERFKSAGYRSRVEGKDACDWVLIDAGDVIVHVFRSEVREFHQIEKMWMPRAST